MARIFNYEKSNLVNGNGKRFVVWFQGCNLGCKECWNKDSWSIDSGYEIKDSDIVNMVLKSKVDGVTFTGGEPILQVESLEYIIETVRKRKNITIQVFTGYNMEELIVMGYESLIEKIDILVTGRFDPQKSNNGQTVHNITDRDSWEFNNSDVEVEIDSNGNITLTGYPTNNLINDLME